jgi:isoleucyl-tRNA synthetase
MFDTYGSDAMRWFLLSSAILRGADLVVTEQGIRDAANQVLRPLWNAWSFFTLYANTAGGAGEGYRARRRTDQTNVLDRYVLAKAHDLVVDVTDRMDAYDLFGACASVRSFLDVLTNWYIRRSRDRFWAGEPDAFDTLQTVLEVVGQVAAPLLPLVSEELYQGLTGERSVHLTNWPEASSLPADPALVAAMDRAREVCSAALSVRKAAGLRVRLPLAALTVASPDADALAPFEGLIADEVNVKEVRRTTDLANAASFVLQVVPAALGPRLGGETQKVIKAVKQGDWTEVDGVVTAGGVALQDGEYTLRLTPVDEARSAPLPANAGVVVVDTEVTPALEAEGLARDLVRAVQGARRDAGLAVSDRIRLRVEVTDPAAEAALVPHRELVAGEVLATAFELGPVGTAGDGAAALEIGDGVTVRVAIEKVG